MEEDTLSESEPLLKQYNRDTTSEKGSIQSISENEYSFRTTSSGGTRRKRYGFDNFLPCDPRRGVHRFLMLGLMCMLSFGEFP